MESTSLDLKEFLTTKMKMSGLYQPVIIKHLILGDGSAKLEDIAKELTTLDEEAVEDYVQKLKVHPKTVLKKHGIAEIQKDAYELLMDLGDSKENLLKICDQKIALFMEQRGIEPGRPSGWGAKRVKLLKEHPYCTLCGSRPGKEREVELDIDHIVPASKGGTDEESNLQVLCAQCNRAKGNHLVISSVEVHASHLNKSPNCIFCNLPKERIKFEDDYILVIEDGFPVSPGHTLIIPVRHIATAIELNDIEALLIIKKSKEFCESLSKEDPSIKGFNLGFNVGRVSGQTIDHCHFHIIPRRVGDVEDPTGGIRNVIFGKGRY